MDVQWIREHGAEDAKVGWLHGGNNGNSRHGWDVDAQGEGDRRHIAADAGKEGCEAAAELLVTLVGSRN